MNLFVKGLGAGFGLGLAITAIETWFGAVNMMGMRMPAFPLATTQAALASILLGALVGGLLSPVMRWGRAVHLLAMGLAWLALEYRFALDPAVVAMWAGGPLGGVAALALGRLVGRRFPRLPLAVGALALASGILVPVFVAGFRSAAGASDAATMEVAQAPLGAPDVMLVVMDTVRAANVSAYGYERATTPQFDALAAQGAFFLDATSPSTWSLPSHASLFTGLYPSVHGTHGESRLLAEEQTTLAEVFSAAGYDTQCFTANPHISSPFGLTQGFAAEDRAWADASGGRSFVFINRFLDALGFGVEDKGGATVVANFQRWVESRGEGARPSFVFVNFLEAHFPYHQLPSPFVHAFTDLDDEALREASMLTLAAQFGRPLDEEATARARQPALDMYDGGVLYTDRLLGKLVRSLEEAGRLDRTVLIVLSDHGELLGEYGLFGHGGSMHQEDLHVPLMVRYPEKVAAGIRVEEPVSTLAVFATATQLAGLAIPQGLHAGSLLNGNSEPPRAPVLAERFRVLGMEMPTSHAMARNVRYRVFRQGSKKLVLTSDGQTSLFDLADDAGESRDLAASKPEELSVLLSALRGAEKRLGLPALDAAIEGAAAPELDPEAEQRLRALGYVE